VVKVLRVASQKISEALGATPKPEKPRRLTKEKS
jgi:hypothetical protein